MTTSDPWLDTYRVLDPPQPVTVELARLFPPSRVVSGDVPLRVRGGGLEVAGHAAGLLHSWHCTITGDWFGLVQLTVPNRARTAALPLCQLVTAAALQPA